MMGLYPCQSCLQINMKAAIHLSLPINSLFATETGFKPLSRLLETEIGILKAQREIAKPKLLKSHNDPERRRSYGGSGIQTPRLKT